MGLNPVLHRCDVAAARKRPAVILTQDCYLLGKGASEEKLTENDWVEFVAQTQPFPTTDCILWGWRKPIEHCAAYLAAEYE
jgi:hypothetical protein